MTSPLVGALFHGATLTEQDPSAPGIGLLGQPVWSPTALLDDLELRLGLPAADVPDALRVQCWSRRLADCDGKARRFYRDSYAADPLGTAAALLAMRDDLVTAGWSGQNVPGGGERLATFADVEEGADLPPGRADRLRRVQEELGNIRPRPYDELRLAEPREVWPWRWRQVFGVLEDLGTRVLHVQPAWQESGPGDLGKVQAALRGEGTSAPASFEGDGSLVVLTGETSLEVALALAALLPGWDRDAVIVRSGEARVLDQALAAQGLASQGVAEASAWRPVAQALPLALELAFEPRDPYRLLELLTLPMGPFEGIAGRELARAVAECPGIGGWRWQEAKDSIRRRLGADAERSITRIAEWLESPGHAGHAPRAALSEVARRVSLWLQARLAYEREREASAGILATLGGALTRAQAFEEALASDPRDQFDIVATRLLLDQVSSGQLLELAAEQVGRLDVVDSPSGLRVQRDLVAWWHFVAGTEWRPKARVWRAAETAALEAAGVSLRDEADRLVAEARSWRGAVLAARKRLVLAVPRWALGEGCDPHPLWDEIVARLNLNEHELARVTLDARVLLGGAPVHRVATVDRGPLPLPAARAEWRLETVRIPPAAKHSASSLGALVGCPLQWVLKYRAGLHEGGVASIGSGPLLFGTLGHRLVHALHEDGVLSVDTVPHHIDAHLEKLLREEASVLLRPGMSFELAQLRRQLVRAVTALVEHVSASKLRVVGVEMEVGARWRDGDLNGRLDVLLQDERGCEIVVDLKWGHGGYRDRLQEGHAIQLAVYAAARRLHTGAERVPAAYFSIATGKMLALDDGIFVDVPPVDGPSLEKTWDKLARTVGKVEQALSQGRIPVTGVRDPRGLLEMLGVPGSKRESFYEPKPEAGCEYCPYGAICGRKWQGLS